MRYRFLFTFLSVLLLAFFAVPSAKVYAAPNCSINIYPQPTPGTHTYTVTLTNNTATPLYTFVNNFWTDGQASGNPSNPSTDPYNYWSLGTGLGYSVGGTAGIPFANGSLSYNVTLSYTNTFDGVDVGANGRDRQDNNICSQGHESYAVTYNDLSVSPTPTPTPANPQPPTSASCSLNIYPHPTAGTHHYTVTLTNNTSTPGYKFINNYWTDGQAAGSPGNTHTASDWYVHAPGSPNYEVTGTAGTPIANSSVTYDTDLTVGGTFNGVDIALQSQGSPSFDICSQGHDAYNITYNDLSATPTTVNFDDLTANTALNNTYAGINWGTGVWDVDGAIPTDSTNSISFHSSSAQSGTFSFASPQVLVSTKIYSNSTATSLVTLSCSGNPNVSAQVALNTNATLTTNWTVPCTTVTVTSSNGWNTNLDNIVYAGFSNPTVTPTPTPGNTVGNTNQGSQIDSGDSGYMNGSKFTTGAVGGTAQSMSVFVNSIDNTTHSQYQMAIYTDNNGVPGTKVASTASGNLTALTWNTLPITAVLNANTTYWLMYNTNGRTTSVNNIYYDTAALGTGAWAKRTFGTWPTTFPAATQDTTNFSIYATYQ